MLGLGPKKGTAVEGLCLSCCLSQEGSVPREGKGPSSAEVDFWKLLSTPLTEQGAPGPPWTAGSHLRPPVSAEHWGHCPASVSAADSQETSCWREPRADVSAQAKA